MTIAEAIKTVMADAPVGLGVEALRQKVSIYKLDSEYFNAGD